MGWPDVSQLQGHMHKHCKISFSGYFPTNHTHTRVFKHWRLMKHARAHFMMNAFLEEILMTLIWYANIYIWNVNESIIDAKSILLDGGNLRPSQKNSKGSTYNAVGRFIWQLFCSSNEFALERKSGFEREIVEGLPPQCTCNPCFCCYSPVGCVHSQVHKCRNLITNGFSWKRLSLGSVTLNFTALENFMSCSTSYFARGSVICDWPWISTVLDQPCPCSSGC